jgi:DNA polymerase (family 10)
MAKAMGIPIVINTDAHSPGDLGLMRYGVLQGRRGGLTKADVANSKPAKEFLKLIAAKS